MDYKHKVQIFMKKFKGRMDVYGKKWVSKTSTRADGTALSGYAPHCENFWKDVCHIKNKSGVTCGSCEHQKYVPVTEETVLKHIKGEEQHLYYLVDHTDNTVSFAAIDFDCKPGKEDRGHKFEDVSRCADVLKGWGVPYAIARSTTNGFHLYIFFSEAIAAYKPLALLHQVFEEVGLAEESRLNIRPIPEVFPKQASVGADGLGNGIKPPMIESQMEKGKNCWVNDENVMIPIDEQWAYFKDIVRCPVARIDQILQECDVDVSIYARGDGGLSKRNSSKAARASTGMYNYSKPMPGTSIEKVLEGCAALRHIRDECFAGKEPGHDAGFALFHIAMNTFDGLDWFVRNVPGWGKTETDVKQLKHSLDKNYNPRTCANLQVLGICNKGTKCFEKKPPVKIVNGQMVQDESVPQNDWAEPSPIRYAFGMGEDFLNKLMSEVDLLEGQNDKTVLTGQIKNIINRSRVFDSKQQTELEKYIRGKKFLKAGEIKTMFADMIIDKNSEVNEALETEERVVRVGDKHIQRCADGQGYEVIRMVKGRPYGEVLTRTTINIEEAKKLLHDDGTIQSFYKGNLVCPGNYTTPFEVSLNDWADPKTLYSYFKTIAQYHLEIAGRKDMELAALASEAFANRSNNVVKNVYRTTQGWYKGAYLSPSVLVDVDGIRENEQYKVDLSTKKHVDLFDFKILAEDEFRDVLFHIKADLMTVAPSDMIYTGLAHVFIATVRERLGIKVKPTLWYEGLTGTGKSQITKFLQPFFGPDYEELPGWNSTEKYLFDLAHGFKDSVFVIDDYKESLGIHIKKRAVNVVQFSYDDVVRGLLNRNSEAQTGKHNRSLLMSSGEDAPSQEASVIARMILVQAKKRDLLETKEQMDRCTEMKHLYCGVTPRFIGWFLQKDIGSMKLKFKDNFKELIKSLSGVQNADRIATNLAMNLLGWQLFIQFMLDSGIITVSDADRYLKEHVDNVNAIKVHMASRCTEEQQSSIFINTLRELIFSQEVRIEGLKGFNERDNAGIVGFVKDNGSNNRIYLYPDRCLYAVSTALRHTGFSVPVRTLSNQFADTGLLVERDKSAFMKNVRTPVGQSRVWVMALDTFGIKDEKEVSHLRVVEDILKLPTDDVGLL